MSPDNGDWLEQLEARLEQTLEAFLRANPSQEQLLRDQEQRDQQQSTQRRRQALLAAAEGLRTELLQLAGEIQQWQGRVERARTAGAETLAAQAQRHLEQLMERGRDRWQRLEQLGMELQRGADTGVREPAPAPAQPSDPLDQAWARFEIEQDLERLRRRR